MSKEKNINLSWDQKFTIFVIGTIIAIFSYRMLHEWVVPLLLHIDNLVILKNLQLQILVVWVSTIIVTIVCVETLKNRLFTTK